jgi:hypothetical protein
MNEQKILSEYDRKIRRLNSDTPFKVYKNTLIAALGTGVLAMGAIMYAGNKDVQERDQLIKPYLTQEDTMRVTKGIAEVFKGQKEARCVGDVESTEELVNKYGRIQGKIIYCKPGVAESAK